MSGVDRRTWKPRLPDETVADLQLLYDEGHRVEGRAHSRSPEYVNARTLDATFAALRDAGWPLQAMGDVIGITRERVRQRAAKATAVPDGWLPVIPSSPQRPPKPRKVRTPQMKPEFVAWLRETHAVAQRCRGNHRVDSPERQATERLWAAVNETLSQGITGRTVAEALDVGVGTIWAGLRRHGYRKNCPSQKAYIGRPSPNQAAATSCKRGHPLSGDNLRVLPRGQRICKACEEIRRRKYLARKHLRLVTGEEMAS